MRRMLYLPDHPLALNAQYIPEHRVLLYEHIGPGTHPCYWCGEPVTWNPGGHCSTGSLVVDHLNRDPLDNRIENLAPSCQRCNIYNSERVVQDTEDFRVRANGTRLRGERRDCATCSDSFVAWETRPGKGLYCSRSCARRAQNRRVA